MEIIMTIIIPICVLISIFIVYRSCKGDIAMLFRLLGLKKSGASSKELEEAYLAYMEKEGLIKKSKENISEERKDDKDGDAAVSEVSESGDGIDSGF